MLFVTECKSTIIKRWYFKSKEIVDKSLKNCVVQHRDDLSMIVDSRFTRRICTVYKK